MIAASGEPVRWLPAYVALGSNLSQPDVQVRQALERLSRLPDCAAMIASPLYRSQPMGPQDQPSFVNAVAGMLTSLAPEALLLQLQQIECELGRERSPLRWGPRLIDLDLLLLGELRSGTPTLQLPHPGLLERNFVLVPLAQVAPQLRLPNGQTAQQMASHLGMQGLEPLA